LNNPIAAVGHVATDELRRAGNRLASISHMLKAMYRASNGIDERLMRAQLMLEELSEALSALAQADELALLDALADLEYVTVGTATTYDLPLRAAFSEVHRSNMTKGTVRHAHGEKGKGEGFEPPNLSAILKEHRK
jgi:predicted HAD superfamily Cof-like phosphohydrolase